MLNLTDENFGQEIQNADKPVVVDFWAPWCSPCFILGPILEKVANEFEGKFILAKVNLAEARTIAQKYGIDRIPMVILFNGGKPISGFIGARPEPVVRELLDKMLKDVKKGEIIKEQVRKREGEIGEKEERVETEKGGENEKIEEIIEWYEDYAKKNGFRLSPDRATVERLIKGMLENEKKYGARYCPCRRVAGNIEEDRPKICPCQWHKEEIEKDGHCFCGLFAK